MPRSPRSTSAAARCSPSTAVPTTSRTPATGRPPPVRPLRRSRRTRWPPGSRTATASTPRSTATPSPPGRHAPRCATSTHYQYGAAVTLLRATTDSINTAFVDMVTQMDDGPKKVLDMAEAAGAPKGARLGRRLPRIPLGTAEVSPLNQASAYATFANDGTHVADHVVKEVARRERARCVYKARARGEAGDERGRRPRRHVRAVERGRERHRSAPCRPWTGRSPARPAPTASPSRARTSSNSSWFVGYTQQISTAVMYVAGDGGNASLDDYRAARGQHVLRRHLSGADLGRLHGRRPPRARRSRSSSRPRTSTATPPPQQTASHARARTQSTREPNRDAHREPTTTPSSSSPPPRPDPGPDDRTPIQEPTRSGRAGSRPRAEPAAGRGGSTDGCGQRTGHRDVDSASARSQEASVRPPRLAGRGGRGARDRRRGAAVLDRSLVRATSATRRSARPACRHRRRLVEPGPVSRCWPAPWSTWPVWCSGCRAGRGGQSQDNFQFLCYSDIGLLYPDRGLLQGNTPYLDSGDYPVLEYPVLTGWFLRAGTADHRAPRRRRRGRT